jgi:hypothetical protein
MPGVSRIPTRLQTIVRAVKQKIADDGIIDPSLCFLSMQSDEETVARSPADQFIKIFLEEFPVYSPAVTGGGNETFLIEGIWVISIFWRYAVDVDYSDDAYLLDPNQGLLAKWDELLESLHMFDPTDADGNLLLVEPMRLATIGYRAAKQKPIAGWGRIGAPWEVKFSLGLEQ